MEATPRNSASAIDEAHAQKIQTVEVDRAEEVQVDSDQSKFAAMLGILRKLVGVSDVINLRLSLPSQLLDPIPNLEYWNYMDRPEYFTRISDSDEDVERMLAVLAWWFSKLLKHTGKVTKPFNSVLGEQFFCRWQVGGSEQTDAAAQDSGSSSSTKVSCADAATVEYITEQVSHHPPVSAFLYRCPERGIEAVGLDHISAKFTGLSATVSPGAQCKGIFVTIKERDEVYASTHPTGNIVGWLKGSLKVQFTGCCHIVCRETGLAAVIEFKEERWFGKNKDNVHGKVFRLNTPAQADQVSGWRLGDIPKSCAVVATFQGNWDRQVTVQRTDKLEDQRVLAALDGLQVAERIVKATEDQGPMESHRIWGPVASKMLQGKYAEATKLKRGVEDRQREVAAQRKLQAEEFTPALFDPASISAGRPRLRDDAPVNL